MGAEEVAALGPAVAPRYEYYYKPLEEGGAKTAVLLMNNGDALTDLALAFKDVPGVRCTRCHVRDVWARQDLGNFRRQLRCEGGRLSRRTLPRDHAGRRHAGGRLKTRGGFAACR